MTKFRLLVHQVKASSTQQKWWNNFDYTGRNDPSSNAQVGNQVSRDSGVKVNVFMWTYFAVSKMASSREAALSPTAQDDSRKPSALEASITTASDMAAGSHTVTERDEWRGMLATALLTSTSLNEHLQTNIFFIIIRCICKKTNTKKKSPQGPNEEFHVRPF